MSAPHIAEAFIPGPNPRARRIAEHVVRGWLGDPDAAAARRSGLLSALAWLLRALAAGVRHPVTSQAAGAVLALAGLWLLVGLAVTLVVAGVLLAAVGTLREAGWL